jgi:predicted nuclease of restriction endonuclease-like RecB superfamily
VAQVQAVLYDAVTMIVWSRRDHKDILRYAKLARLMHTIVRETNGTYRFTLDGPASVLRTSKRYGVALARFLTGLLACREWSAVAQLQGKYGRRYRLDLSSDDGLQSAVMPSAEFDSQLEADFFRAWDPEKLDGWKLERESEILHSGQHVFTPDFVLISPQGRRILLEIVGFWTPEYLQAKLATIRQFAKHEVLVAVAEEAQFDLPDCQPPPLTFKRQLKPAKVLEHIATYA